ncbi:MAG: nucleoside deaminase [Desulfopila sp.]|jgi:tRNA(adenine34) deaminase|nr:nucleoside deaminase [Desulfopila sp.]
MHEEMMKKALDEARLALENGDFPVGCVIADSAGYICSGRRENSRANNEIDHAEIVALRKLYQRYREGLPADLRVYSTMEPCLMCFSTLILSNVTTIVYAYEDVMGGGTDLELSRLKPLYSSMNITIIRDVLRDDSLELFKKFFNDEKNTYIRDSLLAQYTLQQ